MKRITLLSVLLLSGCTTVKYNGSPLSVDEVNYPPVGKEVTAYVGDHMVDKGILMEEQVLVVKQPTGGALYDIPKGTYPQIGYDEMQDFFSPDGVARNPMIAGLPLAVVVKKGSDNDICVRNGGAQDACYPGEYERTTQVSESSKNFQQTLIYSGRIGDKINIGYREFSNNAARPAFNNEVEYDLSESRRIGYKGAVLEVIDANNSSITYRLIKNFPD
ncbi:hypothetical protein [Halomonas sp. YLGW01]|uniref:hypothetical protein n=1 Tax=Halomonas sp. YLGW01 TaxID=2773308 RepID=UPI00177C2349|nr:hypothetical protein [Halomonas sp. YLGW01]